MPPDTISVASVGDLTLVADGDQDSPLCSQASAPSIGLEIQRHCEDPPHAELLSLAAGALVEIDGREVAASLLVSAYDISVESVTQDDRPVAWRQDDGAVLVLSPTASLTTPVEVRLLVGGFAATCAFGARVDPCAASSIEAGSADT